MFEMLDAFTVRICTVCLILFSLGMPVCMNDLFPSFKYCVHIFVGYPITTMYVAC